MHVVVVAVARCLRTGRRVVRAASDHILYPEPGRTLIAKARISCPSAATDPSSVFDCGGAESGHRTIIAMQLRQFRGGVASDLTEFSQLMPYFSLAQENRRQIKWLTAILSVTSKN